MITKTHNSQEHMTKEGDNGMKKETTYKIS